MQQADIVAAEDTRTTQTLLKHLGIHAPQLISLQKFNEKKRCDFFIDALEKGQNIALVSDAGTPAISDPGAILVQAVHEAGFKVIPICGPSAVIALLSVAGFIQTNWWFGGFFPKSKSEAEALLAQAPNEWPVVFFESPLRIEKTLIWLKENTSISKIVVAKELSKTFETLFYGNSVEDVLNAIQKVPIKGEWCLAFQQHKAPDVWEAQLDQLIQKGLSKPQLQAVAEVMGWPKNAVYKKLLKDKP